MTTTADNTERINETPPPPAPQNWGGGAAPAPQDWGGGATGPRTPEGKAVSSRNATTHGLYAAQTVLTHLGEDPDEYQALHDSLIEQLRPRNLMEKRYIQLWLDASWKLQRLQRLEDQAWSSDSLGEDALLAKIERLTRLQNALRRQMDKSVKMLTDQLPDLFARRTREDVLHTMNLTEAQLDKYAYRKDEVEKAVQANSYWPDPLARQDNNAENCQNELPAPAAEPADVLEGELVETVPGTDAENCQNEPLPIPPVSGGVAEERGRGGSDRALPQHSGIRPRVSAFLPPSVINEEEEQRQKYENALNDHTIPWPERHSLFSLIGRERIIQTDNGYRVRPL